MKKQFLNSLLAYADRNYPDAEPPALDQYLTLLASDITKKLYDQNEILAVFDKVGISSLRCAGCNSQVVIEYLKCQFCGEPFLGETKPVSTPVTITAEIKTNSQGKEPVESNKKENASTYTDSDSESILAMTRAQLLALVKKLGLPVDKKLKSEQLKQEIIKAVYASLKPEVPEIPEVPVKRSKKDAKKAEKTLEIPDEPDNEFEKLIASKDNDDIDDDFYSSEVDGDIAEELESLDGNLEISLGDISDAEIEAGSEEDEDNEDWDSV